jgi:hypothetical protein
MAYVCLMLALFINPIPSLLPLFAVLDFCGNSANLNFLQWCCEVGIERE